MQDWRAGRRKRCLHGKIRPETLMADNAWRLHVLAIAYESHSISLRYICLESIEYSRIGYSCCWAYKAAIPVIEAFQTMP